MEALKLAFETVIIGLFALPWLWVMIDLVNPGLFSSPGVRRLVAFIPAELRPPAIGLALFSVVYLLGSMITPVACEFLNDPDMLGQYLPTEEKIQVWAYAHMHAPPRIPGLIVPEDVALATFRSPNPDSEEAKEAEHLRSSIHDEFQHDESTLLLLGPNACERLNRLHEQLNVLRGATFSAFALSALCLFAWCGRGKNPSTAGGRLSFWRQVPRLAGLLLSVGTIVLAIWELCNDIHQPEAGDMPIAELVLLVLGGFGFYVLIWGGRSRLQFHGATFLFALCFSALCYAGYGCVATSYDQAVFNTYLALPATSTGHSSQASARSEIAANIDEER
jgi:hypothetical protein